MKKFIWTITLAVTPAISISSCTEQEVKPKSGGSNDTCQPGFNCPPR